MTAGPEARAQAVGSGSAAGSVVGVAEVAVDAAAREGDGPAELAELAELLRAAGAPGDLAGRVRARLGRDAAAVLREDPWRLLDVDGVASRAADAFARVVLGDAAGPDDPRRAAALLRATVVRAAAEGHTAVAADGLPAALGRFGVPAERAVDALRALLESGELIALSPEDEEGDEGEGDWAGEAGGDGGGGSARPCGPGGTDGDAPGAGRNADGDAGGGTMLVSLERYAFAEDAIADAVGMLMATSSPLDVSGIAADEPFARDLIGALANDGLVVAVTAPGVERTAQLAGAVAKLVEGGLRVAVTGVGFANVRTLAAALHEAGVPSGRLESTALDPHTLHNESTALETRAPGDESTALVTPTPRDESTALNAPAPHPRSTALNAPAPHPRSTALNAPTRHTESIALDAPTPQAESTALDTPPSHDESTALDTRAAHDESTVHGSSAATGESSALDTERRPQNGAPVPSGAEPSGGPGSQGGENSENDKGSAHEDAGDTHEDQSSTHEDKSSARRDEGSARGDESSAHGDRGSAHENEGGAHEDEGGARGDESGAHEGERRSETSAGGVLDARDVADGAAGFGDADVVVVGGAHLLDAETAAAVLEAVPEGARVVFAGDPAEPGPAGAGYVLGDLVDARLPRVRGADRAPHPITDLRFAVRGGELPPPEPDPERHLVVVPARTLDEAVHRAVQLVADSIPRAFGLKLPDIVAVAPTRAGADALNAALKARLNPGRGVWEGFDTGDRVLLTRSLPGGPRAGATGTLLEHSEDGALVRWDGWRSAGDRHGDDEDSGDAYVRDGHADNGHGDDGHGDGGGSGGGHADGQHSGDRRDGSAQDGDGHSGDRRDDDGHSGGGRDGDGRDGDGHASGGRDGGGRDGSRVGGLEVTRVPAGGGAVLRHGWALTARQAVGGEWPAAVVVFDAETPAALTRATVYGAVGLARTHLSIVHAAGPALTAAVAAATPRRRTRLPLLLRNT